MIYANRQRYIIDKINEKLDPTRRELWTSFGRKQRPPILFVGNGLSRLIASPPGWDGLFSSLWMDPEVDWAGENVRLDYDLATRRMNNAERASYLLNNLPQKHKKRVLRELFLATEASKVEHSSLANTLLTAFRIIITTNFDNLLERQALLHGIPFRRIVVAPAAETVEIETHPANRADKVNPDLLIVKIHGSFPFTEERPSVQLFDHWWKTRYAKSKFKDELVLTFAAYQARMGVHKLLYDALALEIDAFQKPSAECATALILGYGLAFDDMSISALLTRVASGAKGVIEFGADSVYRHRALSQWGVHERAAILIPDYYGAGQAYRRWSYEYCIRSLVRESTDAILSSEAPARSALILGQSSVNYVMRLDKMPQAERSYTLYRDIEISTGREALAGPAWHDPSVTRGEAIQVGGQMFVPAAMLDALGHPSHLISVIADDEHGDRIKSYLKWNTDNLDWSFVCSTEPWHPTEHAYVMSVSGVRTILDFQLGQIDDNSLLRIESAPSGAHRTRASELKDAVVAKFEHSGTTRLRAPNLGLVYLSKWFAAELIDALVTIKARASRKPIFVYETGSRGSINLSMIDGKKSKTPVEVVVGPHVEVVLASSLFAMRMACIDFDAVLGIAGAEERLSTFARVSEFDRRWDDLANAFGQHWAVKLGDERAPLQAQINAGRYSHELAAALQMRAFLHLVDVLGPRRLSDLLFDNISGLFPKMRHLCVSLGGEGAMLFHRDMRDRVLWVVGVDMAEVSTLGCGDVARSGYLSAYLDLIEEGDPLDAGEFKVEGAAGKLLLRFGAMGTFKSRFLNVEAAFAAIKQRMRKLTSRDLDQRERREALIAEICAPALLDISLHELGEQRGVAYSELRSRKAGVDGDMVFILSQLAEERARNGT